MNSYSELSKLKVVLVMSRLISDVRSEDGLVDNLTLNRLVKIMFSPGQSMGRFAKSFFKRKKSTNLRVLLLKYTLTTFAGITWLSSCRPVGTGAQGTKLQCYSG